MRTQRKTADVPAESEKKQTGRETSAEQNAKARPQQRVR